MSSRDQEAYDACPYCLTEILVEEPHSVVENERGIEEEERETEPVERLENPAVEEEPAKPELKTEGCQHHFGYLGERSPKDKIPDDCMTCENIVKCMLKNIAT